MSKSPVFMAKGLERDLALAKQKIKDLERQVQDLSTTAHDDIRSGLIFSDRQKSFEVRFREAKFQLQAMKRIGKQFGLATKYIAAGMENSDPERAADMRFLAEVLMTDLWGTHDVSGVKAPDLVRHTQAYKNAQRIAQGEDAND
jgi:hypothetical protein